MTDQPERQRVRPTVEGRARLLAAIEAAGQPHAVDAGTLGEYAELVAVRGQAQADVSLPEVAAHLASGCTACADDLRELAAMTAEPDRTPQPPSPLLRTGEGEPRAPSPSPCGGGVGGRGRPRVTTPASTPSICRTRAPPRRPRPPAASASAACATGS